jgi:biotin carboxyl carrier protein
MAARTFEVRLGKAAVSVEALAGGALSIAGTAIEAGPLGDGQWRVVADGRAHRVFVAGTADAPWIWHDGVAYRPEVIDVERPARVRQPDTAGSLSAPMPATVRAIAVATGDRVSRGDTLIVLEAMKMELPLKSPADGVIASVDCQLGDLVQPGVPLVVLG